MNANPKSTREAAPGPIPAEKPETPAFPAAFASLYRRGVERMVEIHKTTLDLASRQNAEAIEASKKAFEAIPAVPGMFLFDLAGQFFGNFVETQKRLLDQVLEHHAALADYASQRAENLSPASTSMANFVQQSMNRGIAAQKTVLDFTARQNRLACDTLKRQAGVSDTPVATAAESLARGVDAFVDTQKELIDIAAKPLKVAEAKA